MKVPLLLLAAALMVAGCTTPTESDDGDDNGGGNVTHDERGGQVSGDVVAVEGNDTASNGNATNATG